MRSARVMYKIGGIAVKLGFNVNSSRGNKLQQPILLKHDDSVVLRGQSLPVGISEQV